MAEAFGIAGSAFGTISLGLQLFTEISKYLDSVEGRDEDLERAKNYARDFQSSLISLRTWASNTGFSDTDLERAINQGQANCAGAINDLSKMVAELKGQDLKPNSRTSKARTLYVKLKYPFKKQNLENLEKQLFNAISVLQFALNILHVKSGYVTQISIQGMKMPPKRLSTASRASITDVDRSGRSIVDYATSRFCILQPGEHGFHHEALRVFCMLAPFINPATHKKSRTSSPLLAQLCQNMITPNSIMSGEAICSLLSRCDESAGQDCTSPFSYNSLQQQFDLVKDFPEISNYLEFGQLSRLVLMEDQDEVKDFLEKYASSINEINYLGQTPVHIAVQTQNATILRVLVNHADRKVLNTKDNNGHYAIDHATDALCHARKPGKEPGSKVCNGCEVLNVLLRSESAIFTHSVQRAMQLPWGHDIPSCIEGQKNIIRCLALRRKELRTLAQRELTPAERQNLKFCQAGILDQNAAQTQRCLESKKCHVPMHLKVYDNAESPEDSKSIYLLISHGEVAESALQSGFLTPITLFDDVFRSLAEWLGFSRSITGDQAFLFSSYICWLVDHGGDLISPVPNLGGRTTAAHYLMAYLGRIRRSFKLGNRVPLSPKVSSIIFEEDKVDDCRCQCSPKGCTPLTKFLAANKQTWILNLGIAEAISSALEHFEYLFGLLRHVGYDLAKEHWIDSAAVRHFTFLILDLRHTCCCIDNTIGQEAFGPLSTGDRHEIEEEDSSRLELFEQLVTEFGRERGNYADLLSFAREYWAPKMEAVDRGIESYVLTETQRQSAEAAGVVWECYGPQLPPCGDSITVETEEEEVVSELEKVLRELDEIATDPARPSLV
ncbi:hypothetical protein BFJ65_g1361 [Fusarium oxysporum f. sp. cepae]|uniref:Uncharacterized protein n=1 Tax=Fusarium oxysporum f. sp. cepae TaxID=396571 RepID=A0A3L6P8H7_FUSOX|nr:hypothetical protein BFJ65_g1361 [Fusarium oxysporum f. sp. cepae]RKK36349.1 hypothetical protein BFJ67_g12859 [Fusarium oxysporum f. sp. cepae]